MVNHRWDDRRGGAKDTVRISREAGDDGATDWWQPQDLPIGSHELQVLKTLAKQKDVPIVCWFPQNLLAAVLWSQDLDRSHWISWTMEWFEGTSNQTRLCDYDHVRYPVVAFRTVSFKASLLSMARINTRTCWKLEHLQFHTVGAVPLSFTHRKPSTSVPSHGWATGWTDCGTFQDHQGRGSSRWSSWDVGHFASHPRT